MSVLVTGRIVRATDKAVKLRFTRGTHEDLWVPRSILADGDDLEINTMHEVDLELPQWWAEKEGLE